MSRRRSAGERAHALILAAGRGSRLRPTTDHTPKPLVPVAGRPLIGYGLDLLRRHGFAEVVVNVHHLAERLVAALGDGSRFGVRIRYSLEPELLDTGGGIRRAAALLEPRFPPSRPLLVLNADVICEVPLDRLIEAHVASGALATFVLRPDPRAEQYGILGVDREGRVRYFLGSGTPPARLDCYMFASVHVVSPALLAEMPSEGPFSSMRELYPRLFAEGRDLRGFVYEGPWHVVDTPEDRERAEAALGSAATRPPGTRRATGNDMAPGRRRE